MSDEIPDRPLTPANSHLVPPTFDDVVIGRARDALNMPTAVPEAVSGAMIGGRYKLLELIGEGGMGIVWMAEQRSPIRRLVAIKLIKAGMDSSAVLARFEAERQALAMMDHPNIARIFDGGSTERGHPFFVMELVKGLPLTRYADERRMPVSDRLDLFMQICSAVQHAHQKGIIHRDLKPSNLLVTEHDGKPVPKVIDFGLVKALGGSSVLTEHTMHTSYGAVAGTPQYMAPEQVAINAVDIDTRADIYALGVILYELLAGTTPHEATQLNHIAWDEIRRVIREDEPLRPSLRLTKSATLVNLAASRHTEPARLRKLVAGELDWIVMKALDKDRRRRYGTASDLALDLQRHLSGEPVLAAPPTAAYRLQKIARKYKAALTTAALIMVLLLGGVSVSIWQAIRASRAEVIAKTEAVDAQNERVEAQRQRDAAMDANQKVEAAAAETRRHLADSYIQSGIAALDDWQGLSALWFAKALKVDQGDPHRELMDRIRLNDSFCRSTWPMPSTLKANWNGDYRPPRLLQAHRNLDGSVVVVTDTPVEQRITLASVPDEVAQCGQYVLVVNDGCTRVWDCTTRDFITVPLGIGHPHCVVVSPDGNLVAVDEHGSDFSLWEAHTGKQLLLDPDKPSRVTFVAFSPDGKRIATASDSKAQVRDAKTLQPIGQPIPFEGVDQVTFSLNGKMLITSTPKHWQVWNAADSTAVGQVADFVRGNSSELDGPMISPDGNVVLNVTKNGTRLWLYDAYTGYCFDNESVAAAGRCEFSSDGKQISNQIAEWNVLSTNAPDPLRRSLSPCWVHQFRFSPDGKTLSAWGTWNIWLWNTSTWQLVAPPIDPQCEIVDVAFTPDGKEIISLQKSWTDDRNCWLEARDSSTCLTIRRSADFRSDDTAVIDVSPDGQYVLVDTFEGETAQAQVWKRATFDPPLWHITPIAGETLLPRKFSPDSGAIVASNGQAWDAVTGIQMATVPPAWKPLLFLPGILPDGKSYLSQKTDDGLRIRTLDGDKPITPTFALDDSLNDLIYSLGMEGEVVLTSVWHGARLWDSSNSLPITAQLDSGSTPAQIAIDPNRKSVVGLSDTGELRQWSVQACPFTADQCEKLGELIAGSRIDETGGVVVLTKEEYLSRFALLTSLRSNHPEQLQDYDRTPSVPFDVASSFRNNIGSRVEAAETDLDKHALSHELEFNGGLVGFNGSYKESAIMEENALALDRWNVAARDHLARAYVALGRFSDALAICEKYRGRRFDTANPGQDAGTVGQGVLADVATVWPAGNDDPTLKQLTALLASPLPTTQPANDAQDFCEMAINQFQSHRVEEARESLEKAITARAASPTDNDLDPLFAMARSLIDIPSTQPTTMPMTAP